ncbi:hypothetical protein pb186bvf_007768 [Paramecium bursaria]
MRKKNQDFEKFTKNLDQSFRNRFKRYHLQLITEPYESPRSPNIIQLKPISPISRKYKVKQLQPIDLSDVIQRYKRPETKMQRFKEYIDDDNYYQLREMLRHHPELINQKCYGVTMLQRCVSQQKYSMVEFLIENGANKQIIDETKTKPIIISLKIE